MNRNKLYIVAFTVQLLGSCKFFNYAKQVNKESKKNFIETKNEFIQCGFHAKVVKKTSTRKRKFMELKIIRFNDHNSKYRNHPPYYEYSSDSILKIMVGQELFDHIESGQKVIKDKDSITIRIDSISYKLLSKKPNEWYPI